MSLSEREALSMPEAVIASRSGSGAMTALKLPLVPRAHPRRSRRSPVSTSRAATEANVASMYASESTEPHAWLIDREADEEERYRKAGVILPAQSRDRVVYAAIR